jgi:hypothetical protein
MEGGGSSAPLGLQDIGDYTETNDLFRIGSASIVGMNFAIALGRLGGIGGISLNTYFDTFGLEGVLANSALVVIMIQIARWIYTTVYTDAAGKTWSPLVFLCIIAMTQVLHDVLFYYGAIKMIPTGNNEMIDALKKYANENGSRALVGHALYLMLVAVIAMALKNTSMMFSFVVTNIALYTLPFVITTFGPKKVAAAAAPAKSADQQTGGGAAQQKPQPQQRESFGMASWGGGYY